MTPPNVPNSDLAGELTGFSGRVPLFPLPDLVFFPRVLLPLHVFEPRYRAMVADALDGERLIAMGLLQPGWQADYESKTVAVHPTVCIGRITAEKELPDGRFHLVLRGLARARIEREEETDRPYRLGRLSVIPEVAADPATVDRAIQRAALVDAFRKHAGTNADEILRTVLDERLPFGSLSDILAYAARCPSEEKQRVLAEPDVDRRSRLVLDMLRAAIAAANPEARTFPPEFSVN